MRGHRAGRRQDHDAEIDTLEADIRALDSGEHNETEHWHFDDRFHLLIATASGNVVFPRLVEELRVNARLFRLHSPLHRQRENHDEHGEIVRALRAATRSGRGRRCASTCAAFRKTSSARSSSEVGALVGMRSEGRRHFFQRPALRIDGIAQREQPGRDDQHGADRVAHEDRARLPVSISAPKSAGATKPPAPVPTA